MDGVRAADGRDALSTSDHRSVRVRTAGAGEDPLRPDHAMVVVGGRLPANQDDLLSTLGPVPGVIGGEDHPPDRRAG